ncbi:MAG TPA: Fur family transcriptional regulator [Dehalococcoidia bacterium]|nr:Fur family transcriptional regulator [Dehalococcoidia bacterium]
MSCNATLKENGLKLTPQRRLILDILHSAGGHISAEEIIRTVQKQMPGVNKTTIYRTLELLEKLDCVYKSEVDDRFIYHHADSGHHHHIICSQCGRTLDCEEDLFAPIEDTLREKYGFECDLKHMVINGLCHKCKGRN